MPISRNAATDSSLTIHDDIHPSGKMYATWVELILPEAKAALTNGTTVDSDRDDSPEK